MELLEIEEKLTCVMVKEISLFELYKEEFQKLKEQVLAKDWVPLQRTIDSIKYLSIEIEKTDSGRNSLYKKLLKETGAEEGETFYGLISRVYGETGRELLDIYRMIRSEVRSLKIMNEGFNRFLSNRQGLIREVVEELVPDRKGAIYNRKGITSHNGSSSSLVLNRHF